MTREEYIKELIIQKYGNIKEFSRQINIPYTTIRSILERGVANAQLDNVITICKGLRISPEDLIIDSDSTIKKNLAFNEYWYYSDCLSQGLPSLNEKEKFEKISLPDVFVGKYAGCKELIITRIQGDSMNQIIPNGSMVGVKPIEQKDIEDESIIVFSHKEKHSIKKLYRRENEIIFKPASTDPTFTDYVVDENDPDLIIHGEVVFYTVQKV